MAEVFIGIGSSINRQQSIEKGLLSLQQQFGELRASAIYESEAIGFDGDNFYNLVVQLRTDLSVSELISCLKKIERDNGRPENAIKFAPRTLDLDLLLYDQVIDLSIDLPRQEITKNAFVLRPLAELAPELLHPVLGQSYLSLWQDYPQQKQKLWPVKTDLF